MGKIRDQLLAQVEAGHDWNEGPVRAGHGTQLFKTDNCRVCGLRRQWFTDPQHDVEDEYTFETLDGEPVSLREAADTACCQKGGAE